MSLPPTSTKGSGDSTPVTTFQINAPNIPITHAGVVATIGTIPVAGGGTNITTYTTGDTLYSSATNVLSKLPIGSTNQVLTVSGGLPSWATTFAPLPGSTLYVDNSRADSYTPDGTIEKPFLTITAALNQIITNNTGNNYAVVVSPGSYSETINLNSTAFTRIAIVTKDIVNGMLSNDAIPITSIAGDIVSTSNNDNLKALKIDGFDIQGNINFVGASNGSNFLQYGGTIANCVLYSTGATGITVNNAGQYIMQNCSHIIQSGAGAISVQNVNSFLCYSSFISAGPLSIVTNNAVNKPSGFAGTTSQFSFGSLGSAATIDAGSSMATRFNRNNATISNSGTMTSFGAVFTAVVTANSGASWTSIGDDFSAIPNVSAITFTPSAYRADKAHFLGTYNPIAGVNLAIGASSASTIGEIIKLASAQTADALQVQDSTAAVLSKIDSTGKIFVPNANISSLSASSPVLSDASKNLVSGNIALASQVSGILPIANGGTNISTYTTGDTLYASATNVLSKLAIGSNGQYLTVSSGLPAWAANPAANAITALTGDVTATGPGSVAATLATVNSNVGSFGSSTSIPSFTVNGKGLITAASGNVVIAPAGTLSGTTLNATVVSSSLTSVGTIATGVWNGTAVDATHGGTNQTTYATGDTLYASASNTLSKRTIGSTGQVLTVSGGVPTWATPSASGLAAVWSGYHGTDSSWSTTSTGLTDPTGDATSTFTELQNVNFGTVTSALSSGNKLPGIVFTPSATGLYQITATFPLSNSLANAISYVQMTDGTTVFIEGQISNLATAGNRYPMSLTGLYNATSTASKTLKIQMGTSAGGTVTIDGGATTNGLLYWTVTKVT